MPPHEISFIIGLYAGDEGDNTAYGDAIPKCAKQLCAGRKKGQVDPPGFVRKKKGEKKQRYMAGHAQEPSDSDCNMAQCDLLHGETLIDKLVSLDIVNKNYVEDDDHDLWAILDETPIMPPGLTDIEYVAAQSLAKL